MSKQISPHWVFLKDDDTWITRLGPFILIVGRCYVRGREANPQYHDPNAYRIAVINKSLGDTRKTRDEDVLDSTELLDPDIGKIVAIEMAKEQARIRGINLELSDKEMN